MYLHLEERLSSVYIDLIMTSLFPSPIHFFLDPSCLSRFVFYYSLAYTVVGFIMAFFIWFVFPSFSSTHFVSTHIALFLFLGTWIQSPSFFLKTSISRLTVPFCSGFLPVAVIKNTLMKINIGRKDLFGLYFQVTVCRWRELREGIQGRKLSRMGWPYFVGL